MFDTRQHPGLVGHTHFVAGYLALLDNTAEHVRFCGGETEGRMPGIADS
jgi:hypothetical protein